ncbi:terminase small subunit [Butyricicoccus faecihominis]|uniref:terminase small subunit n=1 Tax=Butyricicoccus faecihominis TaxID=1712515 RepID=UPI002ED03AD2
MTKKQIRFTEEYLIDLNATQAAIRAGYSTDGAGQQGCALLKNPNIRARIDKAIAERSRRTGVNADRVVRELARLAFVDPTQLVDFKSGKVLPDASEDDRAALAGVKVKKMDTGVEREVKIADKVKALELLGKHVGLFDKGADTDALEKLDRILEGIDDAAQS